MNVQVRYRSNETDGDNTSSTYVYELTKIAFLKHLAIAGQGYAPIPQKLIRAFAMFLHYSSYLHPRSFDDDRFSEPPTELSDPTEKSQFSNLVGKAIADFLSKRIDSSVYTVNYEAAMRLKGLPIQGRRPDLLAFNQLRGTTFAIEAKGFSAKSISVNNMSKHKEQSKKGVIDVNFTVACVSYNLYNRVQCNYYDPKNQTIEFDDQLFSQLTKQYYSGLYRFFNKNIFEYDSFIFQDEEFYEVSLFKLLKYSFPFRQLNNLFVNPYKLRLILPKKIEEYAANGLPRDEKPFVWDTSKDQISFVNYEDIYIDNDRVGLLLK